MSENIDEGRRKCRAKRNFDSMMSFLLENTSSDKKKITENLIIDSCGKTANNNSNFIDHDDPNNEIVDIDIDKLDVSGSKSIFASSCISLVFFRTFKKIKFDSLPAIKIIPLAGLKHIRVESKTTYWELLHCLCRKFILLV